MAESIEKEANEKIIEMDLSCDPDTAINELYNAIGKPRKIWLSPSYLEGEWVQGKIDGNNFSIWTKGPRRGGPPSIMKGNIFKNQQNTHVSARITLTFPFKYFNIKPIYYLPIILLKLVAFIIIMLGVIFPSYGFLLLIGFPVFFGLIIIFLISFMGNIGRQEVVELETFIQKVFSKYQVIN
jgi:hypothetical protein